MEDRFRPMRDAMTRAILDGDAALDRETRRRAYDGEGKVGPVSAYVATVRDHAWKVTDAHVENLRAEGYDDPRIFELTVATAVGQATRQHESALAALEKAVAARKGR